MDTLAIYDKNLRLISESKVPSGYGIRHLVFSKDGTYIYAVNELVPSISVFEYAKGKAELVNTVKINCKNEKAVLQYRRRKKTGRKGRWKGNLQAGSPSFSKAALKTGSCELAIASNTEEGPIRGTVAPRFEKLEGLKKQAVTPTHRIRRKVQWKVELGV
jgi:hypothetical protein